MLLLTIEQSSSSGLLVDRPAGWARVRYTHAVTALPVLSAASQSRACVMGVLGHSQRDCFLSFLHAIGAGLQLSFLLADGTIASSLLFSSLCLRRGWKTAGLITRYAQHHLHCHSRQRGLDHQGWHSRRPRQPTPVCPILFYTHMTLV